MNQTTTRPQTAPSAPGKTSPEPRKKARHQTDLSFIGRNIRQLRRRRGWTIARLAKEAGMAEIPLGRIERGENAPSAAVLIGLSRALGVSIDTLFSEEQEAFFARRLDIARDPFVPTRPVDRISSGLLTATREIIDAVCGLEDICRAQKQARIPLNIAFEANLFGLQELSVAARSHMGIGNAVVFDYIELFEAMGFRVIFLSLPRQTPSLTFFDTENHNAFFFIRHRENPERRLFHLAYGLGRIFMISWAARMGPKPFPQEDDAAPAASETDADLVDKPLTMHRAARKFAAFFLMPEPAVRATVNQLGIQKKQWSYELLLRIKHRFGVSAESFLFRLKELNLIELRLHDRFRRQILDHYQATNFEEPDSSRRILTANGRVWDLVLTARGRSGAADEVRRIEETLEKWKVVKM